MTSILRERLRVVVLPDGRRAIIVDCEIPDSAPEAIREGLARRALCNSGHRCPCGATWTQPNRAQRRRAKDTGVIQVDVEHEADCPATTEFLVGAIRQWEAGR
jgi:hypothetical protein